ncbi:hypothetical protein PIB30_042496 [Stylosanthes scabra]|uniref:PB1-like domain-containing protein n=1 Tax=Stylosanthes scabra TaxID=79078 RepID=A0ABU6ZE07_9FABA|nr:hypothetical protein [Stylosanthes scabra]
MPSSVPFLVVGLSSPSPKVMPPPSGSRTGGRVVALRSLSSRSEDSNCRSSFSVFEFVELILNDDDEADGGADSGMTKHIIPIIHVGGQLGVDDNGVLCYMDGEVHTFDTVDLDMLCILDLEGMANYQGFPLYTAMYWLEPTITNLIFFEHFIFEPIVAEDFEVAGDGGCINLDSNDGSKSSSHDSYQSAEGEAYKPPPEGDELSSDSDSGRRKNVKKKTRTKNVMTPTKKDSPKKNGSKTPTKT